MKTLEEVRKQMYGDLYAAEATGATIEEIDTQGRVHARLAIEPRHYNSGERVMGGAIFTLADFAFASTVFANDMFSTAISCSIEYLSAGNGEYLTAVGYIDKAGRSVIFGGADVYDDSDRLIARLSVQSFRWEMPQ